MTTDAACTHRIGERALGALKSVGLAASAKNYELWYAHAEGKNPALSAAIQRTLDPSSGLMSQDTADKLYKDHIQHAHLSRNVLALITRLEAEVAAIYEVIEESGENAAGNGAALSEISDQLSQTAQDYPAVGILLENVITVAKTMRDQNQALEARLSDAADEISVLQRNVENIQVEAMKDSLTGVANRAMFDKSLNEQIKRARQEQKPLSLMMADIDNFKRFNDTWGHQTGDQVLRLVAQVMNSNVKGQDILARYGGEEFAIILPETGVDHAHKLADRIRETVESRHLRKRRTNEDLGVITMSIGISTLHDQDDMETLIERADECLYAAKKAGRNCVVNELERANAQDTG